MMTASSSAPAPACSPTSPVALADSDAPRTESANTLVQLCQGGAQGPHSTSDLMSSEEGEEGEEGEDGDSQDTNSTEVTANGEPRQRKKARTRQNFSWRQVSVLEQVFEIDPLPSPALRFELATKLNLSPRCVQVWFQNRRQKWKAVFHASGQSAPQLKHVQRRQVNDVDSLIRNLSPMSTNFPLRPALGEDSSAPTPVATNSNGSDTPIVTAMTMPQPSMVPDGVPVAIASGPSDMNQDNTDWSRVHKLVSELRAQTQQSKAQQAHVQSLLAMLQHIQKQQVVRESTAQQQLMVKSPMRNCEEAQSNFTGQYASARPQPTQSNRAAAPPLSDTYGCTNHFTVGGVPGLGQVAGAPNAALGASSIEAYGYHPGRRPYSSSPPTASSNSFPFAQHGAIYGQPSQFGLGLSPMISPSHFSAPQMQMTYPSHIRSMGMPHAGFMPSGPYAAGSQYALPPVDPAQYTGFSVPGGMSANDLIAASLPQSNESMLPSSGGMPPSMCYVPTRMGYPGN